jgi:hypothetical protein
MAESADQFSEANQSEASKPDRGYEEQSTQDSVLTLKLPADLTKKLHQYSQQSGKTQAEIILAILKSAFSGMAPEVSADRSMEKIQQELQSLKLRLNELEALTPRLGELEGKSLAF